MINKIFTISWESLKKLNIIKTMNSEKQRSTTKTTTNKGQKCNKIGLMN